MKKIFLLGAYGQHNLGDDALLEVFLAQLSDSQLVVKSASPSDTQRRYGVEAVAAYGRWPRLRRPRALWGAGAIVFGGGSLLKELEGGALVRLAYFVRILALLLFGKLFGRPTAMLGVGIGPLGRPLGRQLARLAANLADLICVRDAASYSLLRSIGVRRPVYLAADPICMLAGGVRPPPQAHADRPLVAVIPHYSLGAEHIDALAAACDHLAETYAARIQLIAFQTGYRARFDDMAAARAIQARMRHAEAAEVLAPSTPSSAVDLLGQAAMVVSTRLHGLIFAATRGVPVVALDYEVKVGSFMAEIGQSWANMALPDLAAGRLPALLDAAWARRDASAQAIAARMAELDARAQQSFELFHELLDRPAARRGLAGGALLFASMTVVNLGNYLFNLVLGRWLGPSAFADLSLIITVMLLITLVAATLQTIGAKFAAAYTASGDVARVAALRGWLGRAAWAIGLALLAVCGLGAPLWQRFFQTASPWPFVILGMGLPLYFAQGVDRGVLQGQTRFGALALSYQAEMWVRLLGAIALVALGWAVNGAVAGVTLSLAAAWMAGAWLLRARGPRAASTRLGADERRAIATFSGPVLAALVGQVLINNSDILIVKHFFAPADAGQYAALALIGRIVFFATLSVVTAIFPLVAQKQQRGETHRHLLWAALGLVALASAGVIAATLWLPGMMVSLLFGAAYLPIAPLLWLYAVATMLYALANVVINYRLAAGNSGGSALAIGAGVAQVAGLWLFHTSLYQVVAVQVVLMSALFAALLAWDTWLARGKRAPGAALARRWRALLFGGLALLMLLTMWQVAGAQGSLPPQPAQEQIKQILPSLRDSEAEHAMGAYIPGVGAVLTLDLIRGPNSFQDKSPYLGVRDWAVYLMGAFGPKLSAVPPDETIAISIDYFDYAERSYHQLVVATRAADVADAGKYKVWLEGQPFDQAAAQSVSLEIAQP